MEDSLSLEDFPLDLIRLILEFLFKSGEFHHVSNFLRVSRKMYGLLKELPWLKMVYNHEWYLYQRQHMMKRDNYRWDVIDQLRALKREQLKRKRCLQDGVKDGVKTTVK